MTMRRQLIRGQRGFVAKAHPQQLILALVLVLVQLTTAQPPWQATVSQQAASPATVFCWVRKPAPPSLPAAWA